MTEDAGGPIDNPTEYTPMAAPGSRLLHVWDASGRSLFDRLGAEFTVLGFNDLGAEALWRVAADEVGLSLEIVLPEEHDLTALCAADWVLVRPDQYTARRGTADASELADILWAAVGMECATVSASTGSDPSRRDTLQTVNR
jgi:hypothetical protein